MVTEAAVGLRATEDRAEAIRRVAAAAAAQLARERAAHATRGDRARKARRSTRARPINFINIFNTYLQWGPLTPPRKQGRLLAAAMTRARALAPHTTHITYVAYLRSRGNMGV